MTLKDRSTVNSNTYQLIIALYRLPLAALVSVAAVLFLPLELVLRFTLVVPFFVYTTPSYKVKSRLRKHFRLRTYKLITGAWLWVKNEQEFPWNYLSLV